MDALYSYRRDNYIVSEYPLLVETANDKSEMEPPVFRLPTELTRLIFGEFRSNIFLRLTLTHICHRWRQIAVNYGSLWTNIYIHTVRRSTDSRLEHFLSFLGMQLDRTANLLLDVEWIARTSDKFFAATLQLLREKAPFSRWRSLGVHIFGAWPQSSPRSTAVDAFTNLKSLVWYGTNITTISAIDGTITSQLEVLEVRTWPTAWQVDMGAFTRSFTHISSLRFEYPPSIRDTSFLPANIVNLQLNQAQEHPFPHVRTYTLKECTFVRSNTVNLGNLTALIVSGPLTIIYQVFLPALRQLTVRFLWMYPDGVIEAPALNTLQVVNERASGDHPGPMSVAQMDKAVLLPGYLLSPNTSIVADSYVPSATVLNVLAKSPKVTHATLRFDDWERALAVLQKLLGFGTETDPHSVENENLCPRLSELKLDFRWEFSEPSASKKWLMDRLKARRDAGLMLPILIYVGWKGEGTYTLLTGD